MSPIQQMLLGVGAVATKTYVDDIFNIQVYAGNGTSSHTRTTGIDMTNDFLLWTKRRNSSEAHYLFDSKRMSGSNYISAFTNSTAVGNSRNWITAGSTGYTINDNDQGINASGSDYASWTFRKSPMFDVVTWTGTGNSPNSDSHLDINHSLNSIPGMLMVKRTDSNASYADWYVYHRGLGSASKALFLNKTDSASSHSSYWNGTSPTASQFTVGEFLNISGATYVAYVFAGGESTAATARSVDFDGSGDYLSISDHSDFDIGSSEFTIEAWIKIDALNSNGAGWLTSWSSSSQRGWYFGTVSNIFNFSWSDTGSNINSIDSGYTVKADGQFHHYAVTRSGTTLYFYVDGILVKTNTNSGDTFHNSTGPVAVGHNPDGGSGWELNGKISNLRFVKGTAVYTSSFRPPTEPLTNITNTKLLCCNNSSTTGSTVTPGTITANGNPTASSDSPFDDPAGFKFGDAGDQNVIKCGSYVGNGSTTGDGPEINLGWEPQWVLIKWVEGAEGWVLVDSMRGIVSGGNDTYLMPNNTSVDSFSSDVLDLTPTGFKIKDQYDYVNDSGTSYVYVAIRRSDGYVGKPPELGTGVFAMDTGNSSSTIPAFDSGFVVDFFTQRNPASTHKWNSPSRLTGTNYLNLDTNEAEKSNIANYVAFDSNVGVGKLWSSTSQAWMWKRHAGFDVVTYNGNSVSGTQRSHSLNAVPQMIWIKRRDDTKDWTVGHHGANGGTNPWNYYLELNQSQAEASQEGIWNNTAPTSSHFTLGNWTQVNNSSGEYIAMLFASVDGISKVGYYAGSNSSQTITTGFQPRFLLIKLIDDSGGDWIVFDTTRGWGSGNDNYIRLNENSPQSSYDFGTPTSTGFTLVGNTTGINESPYNFIYYAHA